MGVVHNCFSFAVHLQRKWSVKFENPNIKVSYFSAFQLNHGYRMKVAWLQDKSVSDTSVKLLKLFMNR